MGAGQSDLAQPTGTEGYHVLAIQPNSPAAEAQLEEYFDYIVSVNGAPIDSSLNGLTQQLGRFPNQPVEVGVYNSRSERVRAVKCVPSNNWGGNGLLGARVRLCSYENANENVWHVLDVYPNSPAERAGLVSNEDWIIASPDALLHDQNSLADLIVSSHQGRTCRLYVFNSRTETCREVSVSPDPSWGGDGSLGCNIGYGLLHRIPPRSDRPALEETLPGGPALTSTTTTVASPSLVTSPLSSAPGAGPIAEDFSDVALVAPEAVSATAQSPAEVSAADAQPAASVATVPSVPTPPPAATVARV